MDVGVEFSHYRVIEHIGRGGMADVWSARDKRLSRTVAIKTIARDLSADMDPIRLFEREAKTIAGLEHPHILPIYEFGEFEGQLFIVMRYVSGGSLDDVLERGAVSMEETMRIARAVGQALDYAHNTHVVHLDLKPSNILLDSYQSPYLADFGLATVLDPQGRAANPGSGTLLYMAPEQLTADHLDLHADIYAFTILVFHMVTGQLPFDASMPLALRQLQMREDIPDVRSVRAALPDSINAVLRRGTELDPNKRYASLREMLNALEVVLVPSRIPAGLEAATRSDAPTRPQPYGVETLPLEALISGPLSGLISGPIDGLISRPGKPPGETKPEARDLDELITGPIDGLISRRSVDELISGPIDNLISRPIDRVSKPESGVIDIQLDIGNLTTDLQMTPQDMALREARDIYARARRAYARGQGKLPLGVTDYILIADYYAQAAEHKLDLDDAGRQMLLRGALEYDHEIDYWWTTLDDESRRWTTLHALRSENAPARVRALNRLETLTDGEPPQIPKLVAQTLAVETNKAVQLAALQVLEARARRTPNTHLITSGALAAAAIGGV